VFIVQFTVRGQILKNIAGGYPDFFMAISAIRGKRFFRENLKGVKLGGAFLAKVNKNFCCLEGRIRVAGGSFVEPFRIRFLY
jgi:hypothetical protein